MPPERKRPWYLVLALLGALALGTTGAYAGWELAALYHASVDPSRAGEGIADEHDRRIAVERVEAELHALDAARSRGWPIAVATFLIGSAMLFSAVRALGGSGGARAVLVQLAIVQAGVGVASHFLLRDVLEADLRWLQAREAAEDAAANTMILVLRTLGSALVVVGLTRRRSRDYFDPAAAAVEEG